MHKCEYEAFVKIIQNKTSVVSEASEVYNNLSLEAIGSYFKTLFTFTPRSFMENGF